MKKHIILVSSILLVLVCSFYYLLIPWLNTTSARLSDNSSTSFYNIPNEDTAFGGIWENWEPDDSLPYYKYKVLNDSAVRVRNDRKRVNESPSLSGWSIGYIGFYNNEDNISPDKKKPEEMEYYFAIKNCELDYDASFFIQNKTYNLAYLKKDSVKYTGKDSTTYCHYERKEIKARYASKDKNLLITVSKKSYKIYSSILAILSYSYFVIVYYIFFGLGFKIVISISKGQAFTLANILRFKIMSITLGVITIFSCLKPLLLKILFQNYFIKEFSLPSFWSLLGENIFTFFFAIALFIVSQAFKRGYKLQQEQNLTI